MILEAGTYLAERFAENDKVGITCAYVFVRASALLSSLYHIFFFFLRIEYVQKQKSINFSLYLYSDKS